MSIRRLAGETAIYGLSSILGRVLYFLLTPLYTRIFVPEEYGIVTDLFAFTALMMVLFTYRMETAYFRYGAGDKADAGRSFTTAMFSIIGTTVILGGGFLLLSSWLAGVFQYPDRVSLVQMAVLILCLDALCEIPLARLRLEGRPLRFAFVRLTGIGVNIGLNLFFLVFCPFALQQSDWSFLHGAIERVYDPAFGIGYIFLANVFASLVSLLLLSPYLLRIRLPFDTALWRQMLWYAGPLVIVGFSYVINETLDRKIMTYLLPGTTAENQAQLGIYGANYKLAMLISLFTQAFRYGAEPFFFKQKTAANARQLYADVARFFSIFGALAFLGITLYIDIFKYFIDEAYWSGLGVVPILLMANVFLGLYYNFSTWYKLADLTRWGAYISVGGALITIGLNLWWIPRIGYFGSAWATLICYGSMALATWWFGRRYYPIPYAMPVIGGYLVLALAGWGLAGWFRQIWPDATLGRLAINTLIILVFLAIVLWMERDKVQRYFGLKAG